MRTVSCPASPHPALALTAAARPACPARQGLCHPAPRLPTHHPPRTTHLAQHKVGVGGEGLQVGDAAEPLKEPLPLRHKRVPHPLNVRQVGQGCHGGHLQAAGWAREARDEKGGQGKARGWAGLHRPVLATCRHTPHSFWHAHLCCHRHVVRLLGTPEVLDEAQWEGAIAHPAHTGEGRAGGERWDGLGAKAHPAHREGKGTEGGPASVQLLGRALGPAGEQRKQAHQSTPKAERTHAHPTQPSLPFCCNPVAPEARQCSALAEGACAADPPHPTQLSPHSPRHRHRSPPHPHTACAHLRPASAAHLLKVRSTTRFGCSATHPILEASSLNSMYASSCEEIIQQS